MGKQVAERTFEYEKHVASVGLAECTIGSMPLRRADF